MARPSDNPDTHRVPLVLSAEELLELDDWRFAHRHPTRTAALKAMMRIAIEAMPVPAAPKASKPAAKPRKKPESGR
jgi:hypothetical protein